MDLLYDPLSAMFLLLITGVGSLIHVYSIGYMAHDPRRRRFFGYLNLFVAAMLMLVLSENYVGLFLGWEGVGLASYLLIGFWQHKHSAAAAAKKAFVINRVGDMGMALAIFLLFVTFGSTSFSVISASADGASETTLNWLGVLLLLGACGKSAQVPLQAWLLDAMEGPTPVSALIHAATMVTAGVYLITRSNFIFELAPTAQTAVVIVATVTLLWGAILGCAKDDIKKALAGSTMSQIGYMMLGAGLGVAGYAVRDLPPADPRLLQGQHVPRRRLGHARDGRRRRHAPLRRPAEAAAGHVPDVRDGLPRDHRVPRASPASSPRTRSSRSPSPRTSSSASARLLGAGITGFYMTRLMLLTFFTKKRWADGRAPARVARRDDGAADRAGRALGARRRDARR